jgi:hypothetical protein
MDATSNLELPFIMAAQAQKHVTHNEALRALDAVVQLMVLDKDLSAPPGSPADGARYIVAASPTGAWVGHAGHIAAYQDGAWAFHVPREGWLAWAADEDALYVWTGSAWTAFAGGGGGGTLDNVVEDSTPQLGGDLDANSHSIAFDNGTGLTDDAGNEQVTFHKTASAVNQIGITNAATGGAPQIAAEGADTNIDLTLAGKGTGHPKAALFGVNATADATTKFVVAAAASLFNHAGNGHQHKINKNAAGDTASLLFQTGTSGRAEMGTAGDDDFHFKVSADGSTWKEAIVIDRTTGAASFPLTPRREVLTASRTYFVRTDGSDSNTGLANSAGGAFLTIQKAINVVAGLDTSIFAVTISVGAGTFTTALQLKDPVGAADVTISGAGNTTIVSTTSAHAVNYTGSFKYILSNMKVQTATSGDGLIGAGAGSVRVSSGFEFGACARYHMQANLGAVINIFANYAISGAAQTHHFADNKGMIIAAGLTVTITGTPAFSSMFCNCTNLSLCRINANTYSGSATGVRYSVTLNSVIYTNGGGATYLPGDASGSAATGGQYA